MLLGVLFENITGCVSYPPKVKQFLRIRHGCDDILKSPDDIDVANFAFINSIVSFDQNCPPNNHG